MPIIRFLIVLILLVLSPASASTVDSPLTPEVKRVTQITEFPINVPGIRAASLFRTFTADLVLTHAEPGTRLHTHAQSDHFVYVIEGRGVVRLGEQTERVGVGDLVIIPRKVAHSIMQEGDVEFVFLAFSSPALDLSDFTWLEPPAAAPSP